MSTNHSHAKTYALIWGTLLVLTIITVWVASYNFGTWNILVAMLIATIKATLVVLYFMHVIDDTPLNRVVFASSFVFLAIFILLTGSDLFFRQPAQATPARAEMGARIDNPAEITQWHTASPELVAKGEGLFKQQCALCHGPAGQGDGAASKPPPRDFTQAEGWTFGRTPLRMFQTLSEGSPNTSMAAYRDILSVEERWAVIHYVRTLMPNPPDDDAAAIAAIGQGQAVPQLRIPIEMAMQALAEAPAVPATRGATTETGTGQQLYQQNCLRCHGEQGEGAHDVAPLGVAPVVPMRTQPLSASTGPWRDNEAAFIKLVSEGMPGKAKPGIAHFTAAEWSALYQYVKSLAP